MYKLTTEQLLENIDERISLLERKMSNLANEKMNLSKKKEKLISILEKEINQTLDLFEPSYVEENPSSKETSFFV